MHTSFRVTLATSILGVALVALNCAPSAPAPSPAPKASPTAAAKPSKVTVVTTSATGTLYVIASGIADMATKYAGMTGGVEAAGGAIAAAKVLGAGQADLATLTGMDLPDAFYGIGDHKDKPIAVRGVMRGHAGVFQLMSRAESGIKTVSDISGKKFQFVKEGSITQPYGYALIKAANLKDVRELPGGGSADSAAGLEKGTIDVGLNPAIGAGVTLQLVTTRDIHFIPIPADVGAAMTKLVRGYVMKAVPKGTYKAKGGVPSEDVPAIGYDSWIAARADAPDDLVYGVVKAVLDHEAEFAVYHAEAKYYNLKNAVGDPQIPFHPGAVKYFKEKGVWTEALQKFQDSSLAEAPKPR